MAKLDTQYIFLIIERFTMSAITAMLAMMTVYQYFTMNSLNVATLLSARRSVLRVASGPEGSTYKTC